MNKKIIILSGIFLIMLVGFYYGYKLNEKAILKTNKKETLYKTISPEKAKEKISSNKNIIILDVRTKKEYRKEHIPNSVLIPLNILDREVENKIPNKDSTIFVYCRTGNRSKSASNILIKKGYMNVYDLGGIEKWPYKTVIK
ncbi:thiosulfate sulfurtransferase PspE precursor [Clostridium acetireducens DSM 10703]|jgi:phage shock protein E|uniref:Thiosulfate sulfurtransferase PspE n=1 Tax=Clostridium acetireducens DSM 10703 TaxID=1121290 RepID=A0A1E8F0L0_9CLOT|nr:rhodanese-like domain-containing protein [Clostridium acetireducens]OFI06977.1 thiosulfate sulfurtransferase PspE precursor [Clostridium acetireducens DSM 10703]